MTGKRFKLKYINEQHISANLFDNGTFIGSISIGEELILELLNDLSDENEQLKEHQRTLEAKIVRLKDRVKTFEKHYSLKDIEGYKKMDNCNCIDSRRLDE